MCGKVCGGQWPEKTRTTSGNNDEYACGTQDIMDTAQKTPDLEGSSWHKDRKKPVSKCLQKKEDSGI